MRKKKNIELDTHLVGKKAASVFKYKNVSFDKSYTHIDDKPSIQQANEFANYFMEEFESGRIDEVEIVYTQYVNAGRQTAAIEKVLPLSLGSDDDNPQTNQAALFEPNPESILTSILPRAIRVIFYQALLDSVASEQIARRVPATFFMALI